MKHIKTQMLFFTSMAVFLSCLFVSIVSTLTFSRLYLKELYASCESQTRQVLQSIDQKVRTVEGSMRLILTGQDVMGYLSQTNFNHPDGQVYQAYYKVDQVMKSFQQQCPEFEGMVFYNSRESLYKYNYYNPSSDFLQNFFTPEKIQEISRTDQFNWEGVQAVNNRISKKNAYLVTHSFVDYQDLKALGTVLILLDEDVFSAIYQPITETRRGRVFIFDASGRPAENYDEEMLNRLSKNLPGLTSSRGNLVQTRAEDSQSLFTLITSRETGWTVCVDIPINVLTNSMQTLIVVNTTLSILIILLVGMLQIRYISRITGDIACVANAMQAVTDNNFSLRLHSDRKDEIGLIYAGFNSMSENLGKYFQKALKEEKSRNEAEIRAMFYQIKPHFLYNTLASIRMFAMRKGCMEIADMLGTLNRLLRNTINVRDHFIPLEEELDNLRDYIKIYGVRYNDRIRFSIEVPEQLLPCRVPNMILQPLVENAIEHGVGPCIGAVDCTPCIRISAEEQEGCLLIRVEDNGEGMTDMELAEIMDASSHAGQEGHIGLHNIDSRLKSLYGESFGVSIESAKNQYTHITLRLKKE